MDAKEKQIREKLDFHLKQATELAAQLQAVEHGDRVPHYDETELPAHCMGQRFSRAIEPRPMTSMDGPIELTEPVAKCRRCRRSFFPSAR